jgi:hypothetical protein
MLMTDTNQSGSGKTDTAKQEAAGVAGDAKDAARNVTSTAKDKASGVASEAKSQTRDLLDQTTSELKGQAGQQQQRAAQGLRSISDELSSMAERSDGNGVAADLVRNASGRASSVAGWLESRDPGSLLSDVKSFAARKPGTFIAIAAGAGLLGGRLAKALTADAKKNATGAGSTTPATTAPATSSFDETGSDSFEYGATGVGATGTAGASYGAAAASGIEGAEPPIRTQAAYGDMEADEPSTGTGDEHPLFDDVLGGTAVPGIRTGDGDRA